ncbi:phage tail assembly chaperone [Pseudomonas viridiflava]|uniref:phage tail assembly chaperone n=1 Tax=Pseudomonas viridiflava TaxID=33069 RepID=UPI0013CEFF73|nr:phage tail assembly chaperone [Pseudomonas viridiflava]
MARAKSVNSDLRTLALDPLRNFKHETVVVPEWADASVTVRALSAGDWLGYRTRSLEVLEEARLAAGLSARPETGQGGNPDPDEPSVEFNSSYIFAFVLVRTLFDQHCARVFDDADIDEVALAFSPVHDRLVAKAFELSGIEAGAGAPDPVAEAGNG